MSQQHDFDHGKKLLRSLDFDALCYSDDVLVELCVEIFVEVRYMSRPHVIRKYIDWTLRTDPLKCIQLAFLLPSTLLPILKSRTSSRRKDGCTIRTVHSSWLMPTARPAGARLPPLNQPARHPRLCHHSPPPHARQPLPLLGPRGRRDPGRLRHRPAQRGPRHHARRGAAGAADGGALPRRRAPGEDVDIVERIMGSKARSISRKRRACINFAGRSTSVCKLSVGDG